jgi:hypothetical protein
MMRATVLAVALAVLAGVAFLVLPGAAAPGVRGGPPPARSWRSACAGKPSLPLGMLSLAVVGRPATDEAWVQAAWQRSRVGDQHRVELVLPAGATLLDGAAWQDLPAGLPEGVLAWRVRFPTACTSDLVVRLHAVVDGTPGLREACVRLWECE